MIYSLVKDTGNYPYHNIALEKYLVDSCEEDEIILYLWVNEACVIAGCNQNVLQEWNEDYITAESIHPVRRFTGGGCVYHDVGNLNYSFIASTANRDVDEWIEKWLEIVLDAVRKFGIDAKFSGRNDLTAGDKKFGGTAWLEENNKVLFHGTLMVDVNTEKVVKALTPNLLKFEGKAIQSVKSRVINLKDLASELDVEQLSQSIVESFEEYYDKTSIKLIEDNSHLNQIKTKLLSKEWIYGRNSNCDMTVSYKINSQLVTLKLIIEDGRIVGVDAFTDSMDVTVKNKIEQALLNQFYMGNNIKDVLNDLLK